MELVLEKNNSKKIYKKIIIKSCCLFNIEGRKKFIHLVSVKNCLFSVHKLLVKWELIETYQYPWAKTYFKDTTKDKRIEEIH